MLEIFFNTLFDLFAKLCKNDRRLFRQVLYMDEFSSGVLEIHFSCYIFKNVEGNGMANNDWIGMTVKYDTI